MLAFSLDRKQSCCTRSILPLLGIASRVLAAQLGWLQGVMSMVAVERSAGEESERVDGRELVICKWNFPKNNWKTEMRFPAS